jgi:phage/plasmid-like protein (TIGR03299 family)
MAAEIETMMYAGETPWHGFGEQLPEDADSPEAQLKSGLTWEVEKRPLYVPIEGNTEYKAVDDHVAIVRKTDERILGVVGAGWQVLQPWEMFEWTDSLVGEGLIKYHTAGSLRGGRKVWLLAKFDESVILPTDRVGKFLFFLNGYDGTQSIIINSTAVRVVCMNTARLALADGRSSEVRIRHTASMKERMEAARAALGIAREHGKVYDALLRAFTQLRMTGERWNEYANVLIPNNPEAKHNTRAQNARQALLGLAVTGRGQDIPGVAGTGYAAYNAVTEYVNYVRPSRGGDEAQERRFESSLMGSGDDFVQAAVVQLDTYLKQDGIIVQAA